MPYKFENEGEPLYNKIWVVKWFEIEVLGVNLQHITHMAFLNLQILWSGFFCGDKSEIISKAIFSWPLLQVVSGWKDVQ